MGDDLKKLNKNKKLVKKMCAQYDAFLASDSIIKTIPRVVGPHMNRAGKFPAAVSPAENLKDKVDEIQSTVKFQLKKVLCLGTCVGHVDMGGGPPQEHQPVDQLPRVAAEEELAEPEVGLHQDDDGQAAAHLLSILKVARVTVRQQSNKLFWHFPL